MTDSLKGQSIAVVGGGISGLTAGRDLVAAGADVTVFESTRDAGGVLGSVREDGFLRERAANGFLSGEASGALALCQELGVPTEEARPEAKKRWIYRGGRLRQLPTRPGEFFSADFLSLGGKLRALCEPLVRSRVPDDTVSVGDYFRRRVGPRALKAIVEPFVTGIFAGDVDQLSVAAAFPALVELERRGGLLRGQIGARRRGDRNGAGGGGRRRMWAPRGGMQALINALAEQLGDRVRVGARIDGIERSGDRVELRVQGRGVEQFDAAVLCVPAPEAAAMVHGSDELAAILGSIPYVPIVAVHLGFRREQIAHALDGFGFLVARGEELSIIGAMFESTIFSDRAPEGHVLIRCMFGGAHDPGVVGRSDEELVAAAHSDLAPLLGIEGAPAKSWVTRWPRAIAQYTLGHLQRVEQAQSLARRHRLVLAGAAYSGVAVNDCVIRAADAPGQVAAVLEQN